MIHCVFCKFDGAAQHCVDEVDEVRTSGSHASLESKNTLIAVTLRPIIDGLWVRAFRKVLAEQICDQRVNRMPG
jgi:hypothetical protein